MYGNISWVNPKKGYGFIESNSKMYYFTFSDIKTSKIKEKSTVEFKEVDGEKGKKAIDIKCLT